MSTAATSVDAYYDALPDERKEPMALLRSTLRRHLPKGFVETMSYGMPAFCVPHETYPAGYHCKPSEPLPFISLASQKNFIALYHMGLYCVPSLYDWFLAEYPRHSSAKLDMGKSCLRFKKPEAIPLQLIAALAEKMTPQEWIAEYESKLKKK